MSEFPDWLLSRVIRDRALRCDIAKVLGIKKGVATILQREARKQHPPHLVERRHKGQPLKVDYRLRSAKSGEQAGQIVEVAADPTDIASPLSAA